MLVGHKANCAEDSATSEDSLSIATTLSNSFRAAADRASPGVVTVYTLRGPRMTPMWRKRMSTRNTDDAMHSAAGLRDDQGTGIVIDRQGLILSCNHVVASADAVFVELPDGRRFEPVDIKGDPATDLAVLRIEGAGKLDEVQLGNSDTVRMGDWVVSLASPYELTRSVSAGIVSSADRWVPGNPHPLIQNDAATNPGSSGGALLNLQGEVIGILTGGFSTRKEFQGIGLAIPINVAKQAIDDLNKPTPIQRAYLGCETQKLTPVIARQLELPVAGGLYVKDVDKTSPAAGAGIERGDVITHFAGQAIDDTFRPEQLFDEPIPGKNYKFSLFRNGKSVVVEVQMGPPPRTHTIQETHTTEHSNRASEYFDDSLGLGVDTLTNDLSRQLDFPENQLGVLVSDVASGSLAYKEGIAAGMVVLRINNHSVQNVNDYKQAMNTSPTGKPILMLVQSNKGRHLVVLDQ